MVDAFTRRRVDGLILTTITEDQGYLHVEREQGTPLVFVDRPPTGLLADAVITNNYEATIEATRHLINADIEGSPISATNLPLRQRGSAASPVQWPKRD